MRTTWFHFTPPATAADIELARWWDRQRSYLDSKAAVAHAARKPVDPPTEPIALPPGRHRQQP